MRINKIISLFAILLIILSIPVSALYSLEAGDKAVEYSAGILKAGSYEGYAYIDDINYANKEEIPISATMGNTTTAGYKFTDGNGSITVENSKIKLEKTASGGSASTKVDAFVPTTDFNGISLPERQYMYTELDFSLSRTSTLSNAYFITAGRKNNNGTLEGGQTQYQFVRSGNYNSSANGFSIQYREASATDMYMGVPNFFVANDVVKIRSLHEYGGVDKESNKIWVWGWNPNSNSGSYKSSKPATPQVDGKFSSYGRDNTMLGGMSFEIHQGMSVGDSLTIHGIKAIEKNELLLRDAISNTENAMLGNNSGFDTIIDNLDLPFRVTGLDLGQYASVEWSSDSPDIIDSTGLITRPQNDTAVKLTAAYTVEGNTKTIEYLLTVKKAENSVTPKDHIEAAKARLVWSDFTSQSPDDVSGEIILPQIISSGIGANVSVSWSVIKGNISITGNVMKTTASANENISASIRAALSYAGEIDTKDFDFTILKTPHSFIYAIENYAQKQNAELEGGAITDDIEITSLNTSSSRVEYVNGTGLKVYSVNLATGTETKARISLNPKIEKNRFLEFYENFESNVVYEFTSSADFISNTINSDTQIKLLNSKGTIISFLQFKNVSGGPVINIKQNGAWTDGTSVSAVNSFIINKLRPSMADYLTPVVRFKMIYNRLTTKYDIYLKLENEPDSEYVLFYKDALPTETTQKGDLVKSIEISGAATANRTVAAAIGDIKVYTTDAIIRDYIVNNFNMDYILNGQSQNDVKESLYLTPPHFGAKVTLEVESDYNGILFNGQGKLAADLKAGDLYNALIKPSVVFDNPELSMIEIPPLTSFNIMVIGTDRSSLTYNKTVTVSGAALETNPQNLTDGALGTMLVTNGEEKSFSIIVDLTTGILFNKLIIKEALINGEYNVNSYTIEFSDDKKNWTTAFFGNTIGESLTLVLEYPYTRYRYIRLKVVDKAIQNDKVALTGLLAYFEPVEKYYIDMDFEALETVPVRVSGDFYLQAKGSLYGNPILWTSSNPSILNISSIAVADKYKVTYTKPSKDTNITLTLKIGDITEFYTIVAVGTSANGGIIQSGGGSLSGSSGGVSFFPPASTNDNNQTAAGSKYFNDLGSSLWAVDYVDYLKENLIVSENAENKFYPEANVKREEFIKMLVLSLGLKPEYNAVLPFDDIIAGHWAYPYIASAYVNNIVNGISENQFGTGNEIIRQDMAVMTLRALNAIGKQLEAKISGASFIDSENISDYAIDSVEKMKEYGILSGDDEGRFNPQKTTTRAQSAKVIYSVITE